MNVYYVNANNGDGSSTTEFYDSKECIERLCNDDIFDDIYRDGDGGSWGMFSVPDDTVISEIRIGTMADVEQLIADYS